jgi:E3 ubiquitin-protein ligase SH3RF
VLRIQELTCPECRLRVTTKVEDLPPNILLSRLIEGLKKTRLSNESENKGPESQNGQGKPDAPRNGSNQRPNGKDADSPAPTVPNKIYFLFNLVF